MPASVVKSFAEKSGKSVEEVDQMWNSIKKSLEDKGMKGDDLFGSLTSILKKKLHISEDRTISRKVDKYLIDEGFGNSVAKIQSYINSNIYMINKAQSKPEKRMLVREFIAEIKDMITKGTHLERLHLVNALRDIESIYDDVLRR